MNIALLAQGSLVNKKEATWLTLHGLAKEYLKKGHHAVIIASKKLGLPLVERVEGVRVYRLFDSKLFKARKSIKLIAKKERIKFDVVHGFSSSPIMALGTRFAGGEKKIHTVKSYSKLFFGRRLNKFLNVVDKVTVSTEVVKQKLGVDAVVIRSSINLDKFVPRDKKNTKKFIFYYGAMNPHKGVDDMLQALTKVGNVKVILAQRSGDINAYRKYKIMIKNLGLKDCQIITKDICIEEYVAMADVVVLAYPDLIGTEGNPSCLLEAMACKTPVVTTNLPELREIAKNCVLFAEASNIDSIAEMIKKALNNYDPEMIQRGFEKSKEFDVKLIANKFLELYQ